MQILGIDIGSSSVKAAVLRDSDPVGEPQRFVYATRHDGAKVEVDAGELLATVHHAAKFVAAGQRIDAVALSVMSPAWVAMDSAGCAITPIITHQDRRSLQQARDIEARVGKERHLQ